MLSLLVLIENTTSTRNSQLFLAVLGILGYPPVSFQTVLVVMLVVVLLLVLILVLPSNKAFLIEIIHPLPFMICCKSINTKTSTTAKYLDRHICLVIHALYSFRDGLCLSFFFLLFFPHSSTFVISHAKRLKGLREKWAGFAKQRLSFSCACVSFLSSPLKLTTVRTQGLEQHRTYT